MLTPTLSVLLVMSVEAYIFPGRCANYTVLNLKDNMDFS